MTRWEEEKAFVDGHGLRSVRRRQLMASVRSMEEAFAAEDLSLRKKGGRRNPKAEMQREADRQAQRDELAEKLAALDAEEEEAALQRSAADSALRGQKSALRFVTVPSLLRDNVLRRMPLFLVLRLAPTVAMATRDAASSEVHTLEVSPVTLARARELREEDRIRSHRDLQRECVAALKIVADNARRREREELDLGRNEELIQHRSDTYKSYVVLEKLGTRAIKAALQVRVGGAACGCCCCGPAAVIACCRG